MRLLISAAMIAFTFLTGPALSQAPSSKPLRIVVPYPVGGIVELMARTVSDGLSQKLGIPVIVDARPGANSAIGTEAVARAEPDGRTLLLATFAFAVTPHLQKVNFDPIADFVGVGYMGEAVSVATVHPSVGVKDIKSFVQLAAAKPGQINFMVPGTGSSFTFSAILLQHVNNIKLTAINYKGVPQAVPDLLANRLQFGFFPPPLVTQFIAEGKLHAIGVTAPSRLKQLPGVATLSEQGFSTSQVNSWYTFAAPSKTPKTEIDRLNAALNEVLRDPATIQKVEQVGGSVVSGWTPASTTKLYADELARWGDIIRKTGIKAE
jgi:tripartite-type tricarboxylate transporter receptor subunit TctC